MATTSAEMLQRVPEQDFIDRIIGEQGHAPGALLKVLQQAQERHPRKYLPMETLDYVATRAGVPPARVYSVATFFALFNLQAQGEETISICRGTACHTRGSRGLLERVKLEMGIVDAGDDGGGADKVSLTTSDGRFTIRTVACFGQCALAPVVALNHAIRGHMRERALLREIEALKTPSGG
jgi:NADH-quinone oxidoreductase subunit E